MPQQPESAREQRARDEYLQQPLHQIDPARVGSPRDLLLQMAQTSYQGRNLGRALQVWEEMLATPTLIFLSLAGAMTAAGLRTLIASLIRERAIDCLVSTGANLSHDSVECFGYPHFVGDPAMDDVELGKLGINRVYDNLVLERGFITSEDFMTEFALGLDQRPYTTRELLHRYGARLREKTGREGILTAASAAGLPIYCPALADSSLGMGLANARYKGGTLQVDSLQDVVEMATLVREAQARGYNTGIISIGGGTPRNFTQQAAIATYMFGDSKKYEHKYVVIVTTDAPHWGGLSGSTPQEAQSWRKFKADARMVSVHVDATIALPLLATALFESEAARCRPTRPVFSTGRQLEMSWTGA
ncbi:MAG: deoxyhypusine synthase family protein [Chloroflexi bacterium]|nr:deoxyhypusine synthase family protein [Chloroflexota bacterium]